MNKYEAIIRNILRKEGEQSRDEAYDKFSEFMEKRGEYYGEKILRLYGGYIEQRDEYIDRLEFLEEFYEATGMNRFEYLINDDGSQYPFVDEEEMLEYGGFSDEQKQAIKDFLSQDQYKGVSFSNILTLMRFEKMKLQYADEDRSDHELMDYVIDNEINSKKSNIQHMCDEKYLNSKRIREEFAKEIGVDEKEFCISESDVKVIKDCINYQNRHKNDKSNINEVKLKNCQNIIDFATARIAISIGNRDEINEDVLKVLYDNKYAGEFANEDISEMYEKYCEEQRIKEEEILKQEQRINEEKLKDEQEPKKDQEVIEEKPKYISENVQTQIDSEEKIEEKKVEEEKIDRKVTEEKPKDGPKVIFSKNMQFKRANEENIDAKVTEEEIDERATDEGPKDVSSKNIQSKNEEWPKVIFSRNMRPRSDDKLNDTVNQQNISIINQQKTIEKQEEKITEQQEKINELMNEAETYRLQIEALKEDNLRLKEKNSEQAVIMETMKERCEELSLTIVSQNKFIEELKNSVDKIKAKAREIIEKSKPRTMMEKIASKLSKKRDNMLNNKSEEICNITNEIESKYNSDTRVKGDNLSIKEYIVRNINRVKSRMQGRDAQKNPDITDNYEK